MEASSRDGYRKSQVAASEATHETNMADNSRCPASPWQRGSNENTNGLLRQYFPKRCEISAYAKAELNAMAREFNGRPRRTLAGLTPSEAFAEAVATTG
jgi:IS30 family transposase